MEQQKITQVLDTFCIGRFSLVTMFQLESEAPTSELVFLWAVANITMIKIADVNAPQSEAVFVTRQYGIQSNMDSAAEIS